MLSEACSVPTAGGRTAIRKETRKNPAAIYAVNPDIRRGVDEVRYD
jgi:hypothetical protein